MKTRNAPRAKQPDPARASSNSGSREGADTRMKQASRALTLRILIFATSVREWLLGGLAAPQRGGRGLLRDERGAVTAEYAVMGLVGN